MSLTEKQKRFADEYIKTGNATQAAIQAGYSKNYTHTHASKLLQNATIRDYVDKRLKQIESSKIPTLKEVMEYFGSVMRGEIKDSELSAMGEVIEKPASLQRRNEAAKELIKRLSAGHTEELTAQRILQVIAGTELTKARESLIKGAKADTSLLDALVDAIHGGDSNGQN